MIELFILIIVLFFFTIASIEDIRKREVYDYINYSFAFFILAIAIFDSILSSTLIPVKYVGFGLLVGFALGSILYYLGIWGGGDAKFLIGFAASSYYLMNYVTKDSYFYNLYNYLGIIFANFFDILFNLTHNIVVVFDMIFILLIFIRFFTIKKKSEFKDVFLLFAILLFLFMGLYLEYSGFYLILLGFFSFLLIFFADEDIFDSIYFRSKQVISRLKEGDRLDETIKLSNKNIINVNEAKFGLTKEHMTFLTEKKDLEKQVIIRRVIPYALLIAFNYIVYMFKIISLDEMNLSILGFLFKFLFVSFIIGGVIAIFMLIFQFFKHFKKIKFNLKLSEKILLLVFLIGGIILGLIVKVLFIVLVFIPIYYFVKIARQIERLMFVEKKDVNKISLGDWVVQDVKVNKKVIYSIDDFKLGINEKQLERIKELSKRYSDLKSLYVKDGLAFLPPLFIGFLIILFF